MAEEKKQIQIDNTELVAAIKSLKEDQSKENFNKVAKLIQKGKFLCLATLIASPEAVEGEDGRLSLENKQSFRFNVLANKDGKKYMAVFTSRAEIPQDNPNLTDSSSYLVLDVVTMLSAFVKPENERDLEGIVIDPFTNNFVVPKEILRNMAETEVFMPKPNEQVKVSPPDKYPDGFIDTLREKLDEDGRVNQVFVMVLERANKAKNLMIVVDDEEKLSQEERKALYADITKIVTPFTQGMHLMYVPYFDNFAKQAVSKALPIYRR